MTKIVKKFSNRSIVAKDCKRGSFYLDEDNEVWFCPYTDIYEGIHKIYLICVSKSDFPCFNENYQFKSKIDVVEFK